MLESILAKGLLEFGLAGCVIAWFALIHTPRQEKRQDKRDDRRDAVFLGEVQQARAFYARETAALRKAIHPVELQEQDDNHPRRRRTDKPR